MWTTAEAEHVAEKHAVTILMVNQAFTVQFSHSVICWGSSWLVVFVVGGLGFRRLPPAQRNPHSWPHA